MTPLLVETGWLQEHLGDPKLRIFDCQSLFETNAEGGFITKSAHEVFTKGHIPGAGYIDLHGELSDPNSPYMYTLPSAEHFSKIMSRRGVEAGVHVVLYSSARVIWATRIWWMLRYFGFDTVSILNGGLEKWIREGRPLSQAEANYPPANFKAQIRPHLLATKADVAVTTGLDDACLIHSLSKEQFSGDDKNNYGRSGHIPSSVNLPYLGLIDPLTGEFLPLAEITNQLEEIGALKAKSITTYCGGGIAATTVAFVLALAGREDVAVYDGSMQEWADDPSLPVEKGLAGEKN
jgi:thiosulfate/3-mercaptopyruvate sulfurtransferase